MPLRTYSEFWDFYLRAHSKPGTRAWHYAGTLAGLALSGAFAARADARCLAAALIVGYGCAWIGHFGVQGNRPATFGHPLWSFYSDARMLVLFLSGGLRAHLQRLGLDA